MQCKVTDQNHFVIKLHLVILSHGVVGKIKQSMTNCHM